MLPRILRIPHFLQVFAGRSRTDGFRHTVLAFALVCSTYVYYLFQSTDRTFHWDSFEYWNAATSFSLKDYHTPFRGFSFPYLCFGLKRLAAVTGADPQSLFWVASSVLTALFGCVVVPQLVRAVVPSVHPTLARLLLFNGLIFFFFRDYARYPLTDVPTATVLFAALWFLIVTRRAFLPGLLLALAINFRPVYAIVAAPAAVLMLRRVLLIWKHLRPRLASKWCGWFIVGLCVVLGPQAYINHHNFGVNSVMPVTDVLEGRSLYLAQVEGGISTQKYETNVGTAYPRPGVFFRDISGSAVVANQRFGFLRSYRELWKLYSAHPVQFIAIYARHIFNGIDVQYPTPYIHDLSRRSWWSSFIDYCVYFVFFDVVGRTAHLLRKNAMLSVVLATALLPVIAVIPSRVEVRYFLLLHILAYTVVSFAVVPSLSRWRLRWGIGKLLLLGLFVAACFALADSTYSQVEYPITGG
jgi:hypothetical protein